MNNCDFSQRGLEDLSRDDLCSHEDVVARFLSVMVAHGSAQRYFFCSTILLFSFFSCAGW